MSENIHPLKAERIRRNLSQRALAGFTGLALSTIERAERGRPIRPDCRERLCEYFGKTREELALLDRDEIALEEKSLPSSAEGDDDMKRRTMLKLLLTTGASFLALPNSSLDSEPWEQLMRALERTSSIDPSTVNHLSTITQSYWQLRASISSDDLLHGVLGHLQTVTQTVRYSQPTDIHYQLCSIAGEVAQIAGQMLFDMGKTPVAHSYYKASIKAAEEGNNNALYAVALGRMSFLPIYEEQPHKAFILLKYARDLAKNVRSPRIGAWLGAIEAEAHANLQESDACLRALDESESMLRTSDRADDPYTTGFDFSRLAGYKGICYVLLHQPKAALNALNEAFASLPETATRRRATIMTDMATAHIQAGEVEEACSLASQALTLAERTGSTMVMNRINKFSSYLDRWKDTPAVAEFSFQKQRVSI